MLQKSTFLLLCTLLVLAGCGSKPAPATIAGASSASTAPAAIPVETAHAETRRVNRSIALSGSLLADESVAVSSESAARIQAIYVDFGQQVHKGQIVAKLDDSQYRFQLERAEAALRQAKASIGLDPNSPATPGANDQTPAMRQAEAQMEDARFKFRNAQKLVKSGDISQEHFNELEKGFGARQAAYEETRNAMLTQFANFDALKADIDLARKHVNDCTLRAPFDGSVSERALSPGQFAKENTTILTIVKASPLRLRVNLPESAAASVKPGDTLTFTTGAIPGREFHATVRELDPALDARSRTLTVEARIVDLSGSTQGKNSSNNSHHALLRPGMFVQVQLVTQPNAEVTVVPPAALYSLAGLSKVFLIRDGRAHEVQLGSPNVINGWIEVPADAIRPGDTVATTNLPLLIDGSAVTVSRS